MKQICQDLAIFSSECTCVDHVRCTPHLFLSPFSAGGIELTKEQQDFPGDPPSSSVPLCRASQLFYLSGCVWKIIGACLA